jgi:site-specific DNA recombinase
MATRTAIYARQSIDRSEGIDRQLERDRKLAADRGWEIVREYLDNDVSAFKDRGPKTAWGQMVADAKAGLFTHLIAVDLDRLLRGQRDLLTLIELKLAVVTVDGELDLSSADGEFRATLAASLARFETRRKSERTRRANDYRTRQGRPAPGRRRYGYETDGVTPVPAEAAIVVRIFETLAGGGSLNGLAAALQSEGVPGGTLSKWTTTNVRHIAKNRAYAGFVEHLGVWAPSDVVVPIVSEELSETVIAVLSDPARRTTPGPAPAHLLSGLGVCGNCGAPLKHGKQNYRCSVTPSAHPQIRGTLLEPFIRDEVVWAIATGGPDLLRASLAPTGLAALVRRYDANEAAQAATLADRDDGLLTPAVARTRLLQLRDEREAIEVELEHARAERSAVGGLVTIAQDLLGGRTPYLAASRAGGDLRARIGQRFDGLDLDHQREVVRTLLDFQLDAGRGTSRVRVHHKLAEFLQDAGDDPVL